MENQSSPETVDLTRATKPFWKLEDYWAILLGLALLLMMAAGVFSQGQTTQGDGQAAPVFENPFQRWIAKPGGWESNPLESVVPSGKSSRLPGIVGALLLSGVGFALAVQVMERRGAAFLVAFPFLGLFAIAAYVTAGQALVKYYSLSYALWALVLGLVISNTIGTPRFLQPAVRTELYIKTGLVLLGAEVLIAKLLALGVPGIFVSWVVTPIVLITTFWFGQRVLRIESASLNMVISADMSVCGVSAAIATAAACRAKKEELSVAIGLSLIFTVVMMVAMPAFIRAAGMSPVLGGAWMGGTIDATGAVAAAGGLLGKDAEIVAMTIKMIQNILIGFIAFGVAVYWVTYQDKSGGPGRPSVGEIWRRFPKFVLGFLLMSLVFSWMNRSLEGGESFVQAVVEGGSETLRGWYFCLAFVSIGLETNFRELARYFHGGKPLILYVVGQSFNLIFTLAMAWLMFEKIFPGAANVLGE